MCFSIEGRNNMLNQAVQEAASKDIVMLASASDQGGKVHESWPAKCPEVIGISACNADGTRLSYAGDDYVKFAFQGEGIAIKADIEKSEASGFEGSCSIATAMATGVASLILATRRLVLPVEPVMGVTLGGQNTFAQNRRHFVEEVMTAMRKENESSKYVRPWIVLAVSGTEAKDVRVPLSQIFSDISNPRTVGVSIFFFS
jgi:Subtilase family